MKFHQSLLIQNLKSITTAMKSLHQAYPLNHDNCEITNSLLNDLPRIDTLTNTSSKNNPILILLNGNINYELDFEATLNRIKKNMNRDDRIVLVAFNPYLRWLYKIATYLKLRSGPLPTTFFTRTTLDGVAKLSGFEVVRLRAAVIFPFKLFGLGVYINNILCGTPIVDKLAIVSTIILRPIITNEEIPSVTIVIPARNEKGNIEAGLKKIPDYFTPEKTEIIFVEGHSKDDTWAEILRVSEIYKTRFSSIQTLQQTGKGKIDAVRLGFSKSKNELLVILDADLTMPPELLPRFVEAYRLGLGDFINGDRLVYPMEGRAMKFLNRLGNIFFAKALSFVLQVHIGDALCGTKVLSRSDYERVVAWREKFGDFDPFGDFELLFPAAQLGFGIVNIPIQYLDRTYGSTNIQRFRDGWLLLKMTFIGFVRIRLGL